MELLKENGFDGLADAVSVLLNAAMLSERTDYLGVGRRDVLGCSVSLSEAEVHWRAFLSALKDRGLHGIELIVSDAHVGLQAARKAVFPSVPWQRCQFHLPQNAFQNVPAVAMRAPVASDIRAIFNAPDQGEADHLLAKFLDLTPRRHRS